MALTEGTPPKMVQDIGNHVTNGPTKPTPVWERAWTTEEMRKHCDRWSLAGDSALLHFLQEFSHKVISRTHEIEQLVNSLDQETKVTNARVNNTINDFHMLSSTQFVESRVYDEDVQDETQNSKKIEQKTKEQKESEIVSKISEALEIGLSVMDQAFERVEIQQDSDSEDDNALQSEIILEPKDPYIHRLLPYLIGSELFHRDDCVGLSDVLSEEEEKMEKESESDVSSESGSESEYDTASKMIKEKHLTDVRKNSENESDSSDLFPEDRDEYYSRSSTTSSSSELNKKEIVNNDHVSDATDGGQPRLLADQLDAQIKQHLRKNITKKESRRSSQSSVRSKASSKVREEKGDLKKASSDEDLFSPATVEDDDDYLFGRKGGLFSGGGKLFNDEVKEEGLFDSVKENSVKDEENEKSNLISPSTRGRTPSGKKIPAGGVSILGKDNDLFNIEITNKAAIEKTEEGSSENIKGRKNVVSSKTPQQSLSKGLFDDSDEEDLFSSSRKSTVSSVKATNKITSETKRKDTLFASDEEDGLFLKSEKKPLEIKKPVGGVSLFGGLGGEVNAKIKAQRQPSDSDSDENSGRPSPTGSRASSSSKSSLHISKTRTSIKDSRSNSQSSNSLFLEDPDADDIFSNTNKNSKQEVKPPTKGILFDDDSDLFSTSKSERKETNSITASKNVESLFSSVEEDDLFQVISKPVVKKSSGSISLYPEENVPDKKNVSEKSSLSKEENVNQPLSASAVKRVVSLFDDDDGDDLFSTSLQKKSTETERLSDEVDGSLVIGKSTRNEKSVALEDTSVKKNLFSDEEFLFGGVASESPDVDLFTSLREQPGANELAAEEKKTSESLSDKPSAFSNVRKPVGGVALFGGVDLFGGRMTSQAVEKSVEDNSKTEEKVQEENVIEPGIKMSKRAPKLIETRELSLSFDDPVDTRNTLSSACKDRVRVQGRRRPPSRKNKQGSATKSLTDPLPQPVLANGPLTHENSAGNSPEKKELPQENYAVKDGLDIASPSTEEEDLFSVDDPIKLHGETDLFAFHDTKTPSSRTKERDSKTRMDNIFSLPTTVQDNTQIEADDLFSDASLTAKKSSVSMFEENENDIFANSSFKTDKKSTKDSVDVKLDLESSKATPKKSLDLFDDYADDIFTSMSSKSKGPKQSNTTSSLFGDADDDDIFKPKVATKMQPAVKRKDSATRKVQTKSVDAFEDPLLSTQKED